MSERKYRQRGYMEESTERPKPAERPAAPGAPRGRPREPRVPNLPGFREVVRCARCGAEVTIAAAASPTGRCSRCGSDLHACVQCVHFDPASRWECTQPIPARVSPKDARNDCTFFEPKVTLERETRSAGPADARRAFDDLFKL
ncbi:MAG TPA: hypothetical protein VNI83_10685 [Vicinamibacterales bacterium]|nr:hypothetical protein [Vicinamibacterales bacterium]